MHPVVIAVRRGSSDHATHARQGQPLDAARGRRRHGVIPGRRRPGLLRTRHRRFLRGRAVVGAHGHRRPAGNPDPGLRPWRARRGQGGRPCRSAPRARPLVGRLRHRHRGAGRSQGHLDPCGRGCAVRLAISADLPASLALVAEEAPPGSKGRLVALTHLLWVAGIGSTGVLGWLLADLGALAGRLLYLHLLLIALVVSGYASDCRSRASG